MQKERKDRRAVEEDSGRMDLSSTHKPRETVQVERRNETLQKGHLAGTTSEDTRNRKTFKSMSTPLAAILSP